MRVLLTGATGFLGRALAKRLAESGYAVAALVRARTPRDLSPEALQDLFRRVAPDPQVFEALPLDVLEEQVDRYIAAKKG